MKRILVMLAEGVEEVEALTVVDVLRRADVKCDTCSLGDKEVKSAHNVRIIADKYITDSDIKNYDGIVCPGGMPGSTNLRNNEKVIELVKEFYEEGKLVAAICAGPIVLGRAGITDGKKVTSYPGFKKDLGNCDYKEDLVVRDGNIITSRGPATAMLFAYEILRYLGLEEKSCEIHDAMLFNLLEDKINTLK